MSAPDRRTFLRSAVGASATLLAAPGIQALIAASPAAAASAPATAALDPMAPFVAHYTTNVPANLTAATITGSATTVI